MSRDLLKETSVGTGPVTLNFEKKRWLKLGHFSMILEKPMTFIHHQFSHELLQVDNKNILNHCSYLSQTIILKLNRSYQIDKKYNDQSQNHLIR